MFRQSSNTAAFFSVLIAALIFSLCLAGVAAAQVNNTSLGTAALQNNTAGSFNTASGFVALFGNTIGDNNTAIGVAALYNNSEGVENAAIGFQALLGNTRGNLNTANGGYALLNNTEGVSNTAIGHNALSTNTTGGFNTAIGNGANVSGTNLTNATAIGNGAIVNNSNKIRLGNTQVTVLESQVGLTVVSDKTQKENFQPVDGEEVLAKIRGFELTSWNFIDHDPKEFRHYGLMAQDFYAGFGQDGIGQNRHGDDDQLGRHCGDSNDCRAGAGEAHGGAKAHEGTACCNGGAAGGAGVAKQPLYPANSR